MAPPRHSPGATGQDCPSGATGQGGPPNSSGATGQDCPSGATGQGGQMGPPRYGPGTTGQGGPSRSSGATAAQQSPTSGSPSGEVGSIPGMLYSHKQGISNEALKIANLAS